MRSSHYLHVFELLYLCKHTNCLIPYTASQNKQKITIHTFISSGFKITTNVLIIKNTTYVGPTSLYLHIPTTTRSIYKYSLDPTK